MFQPHITAHNMTLDLTGYQVTPTLDLTGYQVTPTVERHSSAGVGGHCGLPIGHASTTLRLNLSVLGAREDVALDNPGPLGSIAVEMSPATLGALRDACEAALANQPLHA